MGLDINGVDILSVATFGSQSKEGEKTEQNWVVKSTLSEQPTFPAQQSIGSREWMGVRIVYLIALQINSVGPGCRIYVRTYLFYLR